MSQEFRAILQDAEFLDDIQRKVVSDLIHPGAPEGVEITRAEITEHGVQYRRLKQVADSVVEALGEAGYELADQEQGEFTNFSSGEIAILSGKSFAIVKKEI